jgi:hypothetical protein
MHFPSEPTQNHHFFNRPTSKGPGQNEVSRVALKKLDAIVVPLEVKHVNLIIQVIAWSPHIQDHVWYPQMERHCKNVMVLLSLHLLYTHTSFRPTKHAYIKNKQNKTKKQYTSYEIFTGLKKKTFPDISHVARHFQIWSSLQGGGTAEQKPHVSFLPALPPLCHSGHRTVREGGESNFESSVRMRQIYFCMYVFIL